tara:strand:+ start:12 stop:731 length:720 start_codon:yes stop_codon:yes gene_type:complete
MADISRELDKIAEQFTDKVGIAKQEIIESLMELVKGKSSSEALEILSGVNIKVALESKLSGAFAMYEAGALSILKNTYTTVPVPEKSLRALLDITKGTITSEVTDRMANVTLQSIIDGIASGKSPAEVISAIDEVIPRIDTLVNTAYSQFSNSVTNMMAEKAPDNTRYVYIGANDTKTRLACLDKIAFSGANGVTRNEIIAQFGDMNNEIFNCRHKWEEMSSNPKDQGYNFKERIRPNA